MKIPDRRLPFEENAASLGGENPRVHASILTGLFFLFLHRCVVLALS
jgi:hypothetical protein